MRKGEIGLGRFEMGLRWSQIGFKMVGTGWHRFAMGSRLVWIGLEKVEIGRDGFR